MTGKIYFSSLSTNKVFLAYKLSGDFLNEHSKYFTTCVDVLHSTTA